MTYSISATSMIGAVALKRDNAEGALKKARELREQGYVSVRITDEDTGAHYDEDSLADTLVTRRE